MITRIHTHAYEQHSHMIRNGITDDPNNSKSDNIINNDNIDNNADNANNDI